MIAFVLLLLPISVFSNCGPGKAKCLKSDPCCSPHNYCGASAMHCGGGCQGEYSFSMDPASASCYADRINGRRCVSGLYDFTNTTWIINSEAYDGDMDKADFTIDSSLAKNIMVLPNGGLELRLTQSAGATISSTAYMLYGKFCADVKAGTPGGMVTAFITMSDVKDEIDWEWVGKDLYSAQTNYFYRGVVDYTKAVYIKVNDRIDQNSHRYCVDWTQDSLTWSINGQTVRVLTKESTRDNIGLYYFPSTPARVQLGVWDGGSGAPGTRDWAGGYINWNGVGPNGYYSSTFNNIMIQCQGDPEPTGPPVRKSNLQSPSLNEKPTNVLISSKSTNSSSNVSKQSDANHPMPGIWLVGFTLCFIVSFLVFIS